MSDLVAYTLETFHLGFGSDRTLRRLSWKLPL